MNVYRNILCRVGHIPWIRIGMRERAIKFLSSRRDDNYFVVPFGHYRYSGSLGNLIDWRVYYLGGHELAEMNYLIKITQGLKGVMLDVGLNVGQHALYMCDGFERVLGFEPYPPLALTAKSRFSDNNIDNVEVFVFGLGDKDAKLAYNPPRSDNHGVGFFDRGTTDASDGTMLEVKNGDNFIKNKMNENERVTLVKIDVEGMEREVITGLKVTLSKHRPIVFFEYSDETKSHYTNLDDFLSDFPNNYLFYRLICNKSRWVIFNSGQSSLQKFCDLSQTGNLLAVPEEFWRTDEG